MSLRFFWAVVATLALLSVPFILGWIVVSWRNRMTRTKMASALAEREWIRRYLPYPTPIQQALVDLLRGLGEAYLVEWTRLRPEDRASATLHMIDDDVDEDIWLTPWLLRHGLHRTVDDRGIELPDRLGGLIELLAELLQEPAASPPGDSPRVLRCHVCGYDLAGHGAGGACPECAATFGRRL
ncbi:MAG: hypothetical protein IPM64_03020 [Phycisphaerales bacterium]|nr:hypothetical protein [Phycisphaerales bacterium]